MHSRLFFLLAICVLGCTRLPDTIALPTQVCARVQHHSAPVPHTKIFVKYNTDTFPGYAQAPSYYDMTIMADQNAQFCIESLPEGTHWLVGVGYDSLYFPHHVIGSLRVKIDLRTHPKLDTILYVSE
jgi:hypothetical protein